MYVCIYNIYKYTARTGKCVLTGPVFYVSIDSKISWKTLDKNRKNPNETLDKP